MSAEIRSALIELIGNNVLLAQEVTIPARGNETNDEELVTMSRPHLTTRSLQHEHAILSAERFHCRARKLDVLLGLFFSFSDKYNLETCFLFKAVKYLWQKFLSPVSILCWIQTV